jgi:hypothetical protein
MFPGTHPLWWRAVLLSLIEHNLTSVIPSTVAKGLVKKFVIYELKINFYCWWYKINNVSTQIQNGVFPRIISQGMCRKFCGFKENVTFVSTCRIKNQLDNSCLASLSKPLSVSCSECVIQYTVLCVKLWPHTTSSVLGEWKTFVATVLPHFSSKWCYQFITPCQNIIQAKPHDDNLSLLADCVI